MRLLIRSSVRARLAASLLGLSLAACQHLPASTPPHPEEPAPAAPAQATTPHTLQGQLSIKLQAWGDIPAKGMSLGFFFSGNDVSGQLDLMTPLGSQIAQVGWLQDRAWLVNSDGRRTFDDLDDLSLQTLGEALPLRALVHWMQGHPDPTLPSQATTTTGLFEQAGWQIDTRDLPTGRMIVQRPESPFARAVLIKVYLDR